MTDFLKIYSSTEIHSRTRHRKGETKLGDVVQTLNVNNPWIEELIKSTAKFVVLGLPEDIGVRANYGRGGAYAAWKPSLDFLINMQSNEFLKGDEILILGHIHFTDLMERCNELDLKLEEDMVKARELVSEVDERVFSVVTEIAKTGKIPIIIGGGHNNAYPIIKAMHMATGVRHFNVINCDPHSDIRPMNGRHSGNGFHYALSEDHLYKYAVFGLHESYNINTAMELFHKNHKRLHYETYDDIFVRESINYFDALKNCFDFIIEKEQGNKNYVGLEVDLDSIQNVPVSARTPSGMLPIDVRKFVWHAAENLNCAYLHIAEGAPVLAHKQMDNKTGKLIAYLITDFIKSRNAV
ncbi:MAG: arginase family protein [Chitinophagales bacterium]